MEANRDHCDQSEDKMIRTFGVLRPLGCEISGPRKSFQGVAEVIPYYSQRATVSYGSNSIQGELIGVDTSALFTMYKGLSLYTGSLRPR